MPMMRDMFLSFSERVRQVVDDGAQIGAYGEGAPESIEGPDLRGGVGGGVPRRAEGPAQRPFLFRVARAQARTLVGKPRTPFVVQTAPLRLLQHLLDLEHLGEELRGRRRLHGGALLRLAALLE